MNRYYLNTNIQPSGDFEVHKYDCVHDAQPLNRIDLGWCVDDFDALAKAKNFTPYADGCYYCCPAIHKQ